MSKANLPRRTFLERGSLLAAGLSLGKSAMAQSGSSKSSSGSSDIKVGINLLLWTATPTVEHFSLLDDLHKWGYDGAEFPMFDPTVGDWAKLGKHCDELGLDRTSQTIVSEAATSTVATRPSTVEMVSFMVATGYNTLRKCLK